jgi:N-hydroxyarylamine O-acetyltransferase
MDLPRYLARIGFEGKPAPDLATLARLQALHVAAIPFENLAALAGEPIDLDLAALEEKLLTPGRGGWCFEHNLLFAHALEAIGFEVRRLSARVRWNVPADVVTARSHMLLRVTLPDGPYIADVGFGGLTLTAPLRLEPDIEQATPHEPHRLSKIGARPGSEQGQSGVRACSDPGFGLEAKIAGEWRELYRFDLTEQLQADYEVSNWYLLTNPASQFLSNLIVARAEPGARHALRNARYSVHRPDGTTTRNFLHDVDALKRVLFEVMHLRVPDSSFLDTRLAECMRREVQVP